MPIFAPVAGSRITAVTLTDTDSVNSNSSGVATYTVDTGTASADRYLFVMAYGLSGGGSSLTVDGNPASQISANGYVIGYLIHLPTGTSSTLVFDSGSGFTAKTSVSVYAINSDSLPSIYAGDSDVVSDSGYSSLSTSIAVPANSASFVARIAGVDTGTNMRVATAGKYSASSETLSVGTTATTTNVTFTGITEDYDISFGVVTVSTESQLQVCLT